MGGVGLACSNDASSAVTLDRYKDGAYAAAKEQAPGISVFFRGAWKKRGRGVVFENGQGGIGGHPAACAHQATTAYKAVPLWRCSLRRWLWIAGSRKGVKTPRRARDTVRQRRRSMR